VRGETETIGWRVGRGKRGDFSVDKREHIVTETVSLWVTHKGSMASRGREGGRREGGKEGEGRD